MAFPIDIPELRRITLLNEATRVVASVPGWFIHRCRRYDGSVVQIGDDFALCSSPTLGPFLRDLSKGMAPDGWVPRDLYTQVLEEARALRSELNKLSAQ